MNTKFIKQIRSFIFLFILIQYYFIPKILWATWVIETITTNCAGGSNPSAIDANNYGCVMYYEYIPIPLSAYGYQELRCAKYTVSGWNISEVGSTLSNHLGGDISMALDSNNIPHVSYYDAGTHYSPNGDLGYVEWNSTDSVWTGYPVEWGGVDVGLNNSIALDKNDCSHIAYLDSVNKTLKYAKKNGLNWDISTVDSNGSVGYYPSIAIDSNNIPHIAYFDSTNEDLKYAKKNGDSWDISTIDSNGSVGRYPSIAIDSNNILHIAYFDSTNEDLKYAKKNGDSWDISTIDSNGSVGRRYLSIAIDSNNIPHIAYSISNTALKYTKKNGLNWDIITVDSDESVGNYYPSIAIDSNDNPHIAYYDSTSDSLKYANWTNLPVLSWINETDYISDGLNPDIGRSTSTFVFKIKYSDTDNDVPKSGYPKVHVKNGGTEISGSPFTMQEEDTEDITYSDGKLYAYSIENLASGTDYTYYFEAYDINNGKATGNEIAGPVVYVTPTLNWIGEIGYSTDGIEPDSGGVTTLFTYKVKYTNTNNTSPKSGYPKVHIKKSGVEITESPFLMLSFDTNLYSSGKEYIKRIKLAPGTDYSCYFEAYDIYDNIAVGDPTNSINNPVVSAVSLPEEKVYTFPNPATKGIATIKFYCEYDNPEFEIRIYNIVGELVRVIKNEDITQPEIYIYQYLWNCRNEDSQELASGVYLYQIKAKDRATGEETEVTKKIVIVK